MSVLWLLLPFSIITGPAIGYLIARKLTGGIRDTVVEQAFSRKVRRENVWRWCSAVFTLIICLALLFWHLSLSTDAGMIDEEHVWYLYFVQGIIMVLCTAITWFIRDSQRHDLYTAVTGMSSMQLRRFCGELMDEIERIEAIEAKQKASSGEGGQNGKKKRAPIEVEAKR